MPQEVLGNPASNQPTAVLVLGMHRSGTSALTGMLRLLGTELGSHMMKASPFNPTGYWELKPMVDLQIALLSSIGSMDDDYLSLPDGWENRPAAVAFRPEFKHMIWSEFSGKKLWGFKDPRTCRLLPMWHAILAELGMQSRFVIILRDPAEIASSWYSNDKQAFIKTTLMTLTHQLQMERDTRGHRRVMISYDQMLADPKGTLGRIGRELGIQWPVSLESAGGAIDQFLDGKLRHHRTASIEESERMLVEKQTDPQIASWAMETYRLLSTATGGGNTEAALAQAAPELDEIARQFNEVAPAFLHWRPLGAPWWMPIRNARTIRPGFAGAGHQAARF